MKKLSGKFSKQLLGKLFSYSDTFTESVLPFSKSIMDITAPFSLHHLVGFLSAGFYLK
ncbi:MAG: hypothetical protein ACUVRG_04135 [Ignavibacterium sp.]|uniref:hypothetical protein n=1 Tax=Ignavibacterium sp. TaxID=2651167 RepID=UPI00404ACE1D